MKIRGLLIGANCFLLCVVFLSVLAWYFSGAGINYFAPLSKTSIYLFNFMLSISICYSAYLCSLLLTSKRKGPRLIFYWNIFLSLCISVPLIGGHALLILQYGLEFDAIDQWMSGANLLKLFLSTCLLAMAVIFKDERIAKTFNA